MSVLLDWQPHRPLRQVWKGTTMTMKAKTITWRQDWQPQQIVPQTYTWESQEWQYPRKGKPGINYYLGVMDAQRAVDCLLWYGPDKRLHGILNYYGPEFDYPGSLERPGNVSVFVDPAWRGKGIATALCDEAVRRWPHLDPKQQTYSVDGVQFIDRYLGKRSQA